MSPGETSTDLEIEKMLDQVLEQVRLATSATAAAIALKSGDEMVCRAAAGSNAPDVGVRLDVGTGLSGACARSREVQYCADAETDPRVNAAASRRLQVRSVLVVPLEAGDELLGIFEIFSPHSGAFGNRDLQNLQTLAKVIVENLRELWAIPQSPPNASDPVSVLPAGPPVESAVVAPPSVAPAEIDLEDEPRFAWPTGLVEKSPAEKEDKRNEEKQLEQPKAPEQVQAPSPAVKPAVSGWPSVETSGSKAEISSLPVAPPAKLTRERRAREWGTSLLTGAVITVAVVLGWTVGRPRWQRAVGEQSKQAAANTANGPADFAEGHGSASASRSRDTEVARPSNDSTTHAPEGSADNSSGGLVISQNGRIIFRQSPRSWPAGQPSAQLKPDPEPAEKAATVFLSPLMASARLVQRIEPVYPETALQTHVQGEVELEALVGKDGSVEQLKLLSGDPQLAAAAADAIRQWRFRPYQSDGQIVEFSTRLSIDFRLP